jgi:hypothetical protein
MRRNALRTALLLACAWSVCFNHDNSDWLGGWAFAKGKKFESPAPPDFIRKAYNDDQK